MGGTGTMKKKILALVLCITLSLPLCLKIEAASLSSAQKLNELGLLSNISYSELNAPLNRLVGITMLLKAMGYKDKDAVAAADKTNFFDIKGEYAWGTGWVNIALEKSLTTGTSKYLFSPGDTLTKSQFATFILRILGYDMQESYENTAILAKEAGLIEKTSELSDSYFTKAEAAELLYKALSSKIKDKGNLTLIEQMLEQGLVDRDTAISVGVKGATNLRVSEVEPLSNRYIKVILEEAVEEVNIEDFKLTYEEDEEEQTDIEHIELLLEGKFLLIRTDEQEEDELYTLSINSDSFTFNSIDDESTKPRLIDAEAISNTSVRLIFNEKVSEEALDKANYDIDNLTVKAVRYETISPEREEVTIDDLDVLEDEEQEEEEDEILLTNIILTTSSQTRNKSYRVDVEDITDLCGNSINTSYDDESFLGASTSTASPRLEDVEAYSRTKLIVTFSKELNRESAEDIDNYSISGLTIYRALLDEDGETVYLLTSEQKLDTKYTLYVNDVEDLEGNEIHSSYDDEYFYSDDGDSSAPRLISAEAVTNTTVRIEFNEPVDENTALMEHAYYLGELLGYPIDVEVDEDENDGKTFIIHTQPQEDEEYTITVKGVKDRAGNLINPSYTEETFTGIE